MSNPIKYTDTLEYGYMQECTGQLVCSAEKTIELFIDKVFRENNIRLVDYQTFLTETIKTERRNDLNPTRRIDYSEGDDAPNELADAPDDIIEAMTPLIL